MILMVVPSCTLPSGAGVLADPMVVTQTYQALDAVAGATVQAIQTQEAQATFQASLPTPTFTPGPPTSTPTPTYTSTPVIPIIQVSIDTNCRSGPGKTYDMIGALMVGETTTIIARSSIPNYWVVDNPDYRGHSCWLWAQYATVVGNTSLLPIDSAPPTPTPAPGSIRGYVYIDGNHNDQRGNPADGHISGANLFLKEGSCPGTATFATTSSSSADGSYSFSNVPAGNYCLWRDMLQQTLDPDFYSINLNPGEDYSEVNFRYLP